jgi:aspartate racemase
VPTGKTQHIGIVACSSEGAALCYRTICLEAAARMGAHAHPEVSLHTHSLAEYTEALRAEGWGGVARLMLSSADKLARAGADFLVCPDNTVHQAFAEVAARSPRPWLHIAAVVADAAVLAGHRRLGILGTRWLMEGPVYPEQLDARGLGHVLPEEAERADIDRTIFEELVNGRFSAESRARFAAIIGRLEARGCDAVVLGCTEIPLLIGREDSSLPTLDSTRLLARAALARALG